MQFFKMLRISINVFSIPIVLTACKMQNIPVDAQKISEVPETLVTINHESAQLIVGAEERALFTDQSYADHCLLSIEKPEKTQTQWNESHTVWERISTQMELEQDINQQRRINAELRWYENHPAYMTRVSKRAERYAYYVTEQVTKYDLPIELVLLPIVESAYDPFAYSHGRASGMWQFIPSTGLDFKLKQNWWYDGRRDVVASTEAALKYLTKLNNMFDGDWLLALAAYNAGQGTVSRAIKKNKRRGKATDFWSLDLPRETRSYVPKLLALAKIFTDPVQYGITLHPVANKPFFSVVDTKSQLDLAQAAKMADINIEEVYRLNPGYSRWATAPKGPHRLLVPITQTSYFEEQLEQYDPKQRLHWTRHTVRRGDSLLRLAKRFNTTKDLIKQTNNLRGNTIRTGQSLMIPHATKGQSRYTLSALQRLHRTQNKPADSRSNKNKQLVYTVNSGDSLWRIAKKYDVKVSKLAKWNAMAPKDMLRPGQKLSIWTSPTLATAPKTGIRDSIVKKVGYKVRSGDSLSRIAQRFNLHVGDILKWNTVSIKKYLQPGQLLTLYVNIAGSVK